MTPSVTFNPNLLQPDAQEFIAQLRADDPVRASAEWDGVWRNDLEAFISCDVVEDAVVRQRRELLWAQGINYSGFTDQAGGSGDDSSALCIAHRDKTGQVIIDCIRERKPPFSPEGVTAEFVDVLKQYQIRKVVGDHYAGDWPREQFRKRGIDYIPADKTKSELYVEFLPLLNSGKVELLDHPSLVGQLCALERKVGRGTGREQVDHPPRGRDDVSNVVAGAAVTCATRHRPVIISDAALQWARGVTVSSTYTPSGQVACFAGDQFISRRH
jgi:hypothetical protein